MHAVLCLGVAEGPPREEGQRDGERRDADVEADALRAGQKQQRRDRRLADDEELRDAPLRHRGRRRASACDRFIHRHHFAREPLRIEAAARRCARARRRALAATRRRRASRTMHRDKSAASPGVCVSASSPASTSSAAPPERARDHRAAAGHRFRDDQAERLGARAGVDDDVERAHRRRRGQEPREADAVRRDPSRSASACSSSSVCWLPAVSYTRAADDVAADRQVGGNRGEGPQKHIVSLPARERRHQADAHDRRPAAAPGPRGGRDPRPVRQARTSADPRRCGRRAPGAAGRSAAVDVGRHALRVGERSRRRWR